MPLRQGVGSAADTTAVLIEACIANDRRADNGSPDLRAQILDRPRIENADINKSFCARLLGLTAQPGAASALEVPHPVAHNAGLSVGLVEDETRRCQHCCDHPQGGRAANQCELPLG